VINSDDKNLLLSELMICGVIIYDITQERDQIKEACWVLKGNLNTNILIQINCFHFKIVKRETIFVNKLSFTSNKEIFVFYVNIFH